MSRIGNFHFSASAAAKSAASMAGFEKSVAQRICMEV
jgi:hypothetical protein